MSPRFKIGDTVYIVPTSAKPRRLMTVSIVEYCETTGLYKIKYSQKMREWWLRRRPWVFEKSILNLEEAVAWKLMR